MEVLSAPLGTPIAASSPTPGGTTPFTLEDALGEMWLLCWAEQRGADALSKELQAMNGVRPEDLLWVLQVGVKEVAGGFGGPESPSIGLG
jgi:hypothetical protein